ncbi:MAG: DEAD/DEAH box helicase [Acholeplasmatales bacterium]|nr:DEAD/DEAH box helicase [Acholeplasmatales bacterium]
MNDFEKLNVREDIIDCLNKENILVPTPIQEEAIPLLKEGFDCIGQAQTGTGKTFAYAIPLIEGIDPKEHDPKALVLTPTRELGIQVSNEIGKLLLSNKDIKYACIYGGESYDKQRIALSKKPQIIIGTPGRIIDQMERGNLKFNQIRYLVLDEADEMLKMGFQEDLEKILSSMPKDRQTALFSATIPPFIKNVVKNYMNDPKWVKIESKTLTVEAIDQQLYYCKKDSKKDLLIRLLDYNQFHQIMIFCNTKSMVDELVIFLQTQGFRAEGLHGDLKQISRDKVMQSFRNNTIDILIATDVAARGIDIDGIDAVINFDVPNENELYVHRIGRTARAGTSGTAITISTIRNKGRISDLERYTKSKIRVCEIPTPKEIEKSYQKKLYLKIMDAIDKNIDNHEYDNLLMKLARGNSDPMPLLNALVSMIDENKGRQYPEIVVQSVKENRSKKDSKEKNKKDSNKTFSIIEINVGQKDGVRPNQMVVYFHDEFKIHREHFGKIIIENKRSFIEVHNEALRFLRNFKGKKFMGRSLNIKIVDSFPR